MIDDDRHSDARERKGPWPLCPPVPRRRRPGRAPPIDPPCSMPAAPELRSFTKEIEIAAPAPQAYALWTDSAAWMALMGPDSRANFDLEIGGRYEWLFDGKVGSNGCQVLSYIPGRWSASPGMRRPGQAMRERRTWVVVETEALTADSTRIRLTHLGFGQGAAWDETYDYFDKAWGRVLPMMKGALEAAAK